VGFNLGIELTQLLVVALVMPSLMVLSRTVAYPALRTCAATVGATLASAWLAERTGLLSSDPLGPMGEVLVNHPLVLATTLAVLALVMLTAQRVGYLPEPAGVDDVRDELPQEPRLLRDGVSR
jgi:hypothetical protein